MWRLCLLAFVVVFLLSSGLPASAEQPVALEAPVSEAGQGLFMSLSEFVARTEAGDGGGADSSAAEPPKAIVSGDYAGARESDEKDELKSTGEPRPVAEIGDSETAGPRDDLEELLSNWRVTRSSVVYDQDSQEDEGAREAESVKQDEVPPSWERRGIQPQAIEAVAVADDGDKAGQEGFFPEVQPPEMQAPAVRLRELVERSASTPQSNDAETLPAPSGSPQAQPTLLPPVRVSGRAYRTAEDDLHPGREILDIASVVRRAVDSHPVIAESIGRFFQQNEQVAVSRAGYFPRLSSGIRTGYRDSIGRSEDAFTVSASQMLYDFGKVSSSVAAAASGVERDRAGVLLAVDQLARETVHAAVEVQRFRSLLHIAGEQVKAITGLQELAAQRSTRGASTRSDEIQALSRKEAARAMELQFRAQLDVWERTLQNLVGTESSLTVSDDFPGHLDQACALATEDFDNVPEIMRAEAERAEARAIIRQARAERLPTLSFNANYEHYLGRSPNEIAINDDQDFTITLDLTTNLFQGGAMQARRRAAGHALQAATAARDAAYRSVSRGLREARVQTGSLAARLDLLDDRYRSIVETQELYRQQYLSLGTRTLLDILNTEQEIHQSRFDRQNTLFDLRRLQIECLYSVAGIRAAFGLDSGSVQGVSIRP